MKWYWYLLFTLIILIAGYILGVFLPFNLGPCEIIDTPITKGDYYGNWINGFVAFGTIAAVILSLFLDDIKTLFKKVSFKINLDSEDALEDLYDTKNNRKALKYYNDINIINEGNINALRCELYLESAEFFKTSTCKNGTPHLVENRPIKWGYDNSTDTYIPSKGKKKLRIFEMFAPIEQSNPDEKDEKHIPAQYNFAGLSEKINANSGKWVLTYCINSTNSKPKRFKLNIEWDGEWEERQQDMSKSLTTKIESL